MTALDLRGRTALVTGATGELGRAMVRTLARCGADVIVHYHRNKAKADELVAELVGQGAKGAVVKADVTDAGSVTAMRDAAGAALGLPDIVVNNAVMPHAWASVAEQAPEVYAGQFRSSVLHGVLMAKAFLPAMIEKKWGRVIAISTDCAMQNFPGQAAYVAAKRGLDGVLRALAREAGPHGVTVNQVMPGWMISDRERDAGTIAATAYPIPLGHRGQDQDVANAVAFLASDLAAFITGAIVPVCGGTVMPAI